ncbi:MAG: hypothetical protein OEV91_04835 [Desulfobulbaceae bacterium]|nr:hypothetical protein [Desulfobulbaceae bacterium]
MKKFLSVAAALGLVAGVASTASALDFSVSGSYSVTGNYLSKSDGTGFDVTEGAADPNAPDAYWMHSFIIKPTMKVNDNISMLSQIRLADSAIWGQANGDASVVANGSGYENNNDVLVAHLYMQYLSPVGKFHIGRVPSGAWGTVFLDQDSRANGIKWWPNFLASGPWSTYFSVTKATEADAQAANEVADGDSDSYEGRINFKNDVLDAGIRYVYGDVDTTAANDTVNETMGFYGVYKFGTNFAGTEIVHLAGSIDDNNVATNVDDRSATAALVKVGGKFDNLSLLGAYMYLSGDDDTHATLGGDREAFAALNGGTGSEFTPLYILTGRGMGMLNPDINGADAVTGGAVANAGAHALVLMADYKVSDKLSLHGGIAYAQADEEVDSHAGAAKATSYLGRDDEYGWEYNVGAAYKLLDNLTYEAHFGYLDTGDFFDSTLNAGDADAVYLLSHSLTMTF